MQPLSAQAILRVWEEGQAQHPVDRALRLLFHASPEATGDELAALSVGQRNARLLALRAGTFGPTLGGVADCPQCGQRVDLTLDSAQLRAEPPTAGESSRELVAEGYRLRFRLPDSHDLAAVAGCDDVSAARELLIERCVLEARAEDAAVAAGELPAEVLERLAARIAECDPQAELLLDLRCPECDHVWQLELDVVSFFWEEICVCAERLLREVDALARAYAWSEAEILALSAARRRRYLEMVT